MARQSALGHGQSFTPLTVTVSPSCSASSRPTVHWQQARRHVHMLAAVARASASAGPPADSVASLVVTLSVQTLASAHDLYKREATCEYSRDSQVRGPDLTGPPRVGPAFKVFLFKVYNREATCEYSRDSQVPGPDRTSRPRVGPAGPLDHLVKGEREEAVRVWYGNAEQ